MTEFKIVPFLSLSEEQKIEAVKIGHSSGGIFKNLKNLMFMARVRRFSKPNEIVFVMLKDREPYGIIAASRSLWRKKKCLSINHLFTKQSVKYYKSTGKTIGEALSEKVVRKAIVEGCPLIGAFLPFKSSRRLLQRYVNRGNLEPIKGGISLTKRYRIKRI